MIDDFLIFVNNFLKRFFVFIWRFILFLAVVKVVFFM